MLLCEKGYLYTGLVVLTWGLCGCGSSGSNAGSESTWRLSELRVNYGSTGEEVVIDQGAAAYYFYSADHELANTFETAISPYSIDSASNEMPDELRGRGEMGVLYSGSVQPIIRVEFTNTSAQDWIEKTSIWQANEENTQAEGEIIDALLNGDDPFTEGEWFDRSASDFIHWGDASYNWGSLSEDWAGIDAVETYFTSFEFETHFASNGEASPVLDAEGMALSNDALVPLSNRGDDAWVPLSDRGDDPPWVINEEDFPLRLNNDKGQLLELINQKDGGEDYVLEYQENSLVHKVTRVVRAYENMEWGVSTPEVRASILYNHRMIDGRLTSTISEDDPYGYTYTYTATYERAPCGPMTHERANKTVPSYFPICVSLPD